MRTAARWTLVLILLLGARIAMADAFFAFQCPATRYGSVPLGGEKIFSSSLTCTAISPDSVDVIFDPHLPDGWFAQWGRYTAPNTWYTQNKRIRLVPGQLDSLRIDVTGDWMKTGTGFVDITIRAAADSLSKDHCTYTLFDGIPVPTRVGYTFNCGTGNTAWVADGTNQVALRTPFENIGNVRDTLLVIPRSNLPAGWFAQFCQVSTGTCYFGNAQLPMAVAAWDTLLMDFYTVPGTAAGWYDLEIHSKRNPSIFEYCRYQVFQGTSYQGVSPTSSVSISNGDPRALQVLAQPNPFSNSTILQLRGPVSSNADLTIFSADGRLVRDFSALSISPAATRVTWNGQSQSGAQVPTGVYFYRLQAGAQNTRGLVVRTR